MFGDIAVHCIITLIILVINSPLFTYKEVALSNSVLIGDDSDVNLPGIIVSPVMIYIVIINLAGIMFGSGTWYQIILVFDF
jgi:hypothetical protein